MTVENGMKVAVRARPLFKDENENGTINILNFFEEKPKMISALDKLFEFDHVFQPDCDQATVFQTLVEPLVYKLRQGFNCTILAYGSTGTGKTYTMGTLPQTGVEADNGIITRTLDSLLQDSSTADDPDYEVSVSFIEIYNGKVYDVLRNTNKAITTLHARKQQIGFVVHSSLQALGLLERGSKARHTRSTVLNSGSSRSHAVFTIHYKKTNENNETLTSKLHLVDLAGSEGVRRTGACGAAFAEGVTINQGLLAVGKVMRGLVRGEGKVNYRDDVLTAVLQDALNLKSYVTLLACISSSSTEAAMTVDSLRFAAHARGARIKPEQLRAFNQYKAENASIFEGMRTLICKVPPTPAVSKLWHPKQYVAGSSPTLSDISESSNESSASVSALTGSSIDNTYSPVIRKCMEGLESQLEEKLNNIVHSVMKENGGRLLEIQREPSPMTELLDAAATPLNKNIKDSAQWNILYTQVRTIVRDELSSIFKLQTATTDVSPVTASPDMRVTKDQVTRRLGFADDEDGSELQPKDHNFKVPALPALKPTKVRKRKIPPPPTFLENIESLHDSANKRMTGNFENEDTSIFPFETEKTPRRKSRRIETKKSMMENKENEDAIAEKPVRRSIRLSNVFQNLDNMNLNTPNNLSAKLDVSSSSTKRISVVRRRLEADLACMTPTSRTEKRERLPDTLLSLHRNSVFEVLNYGSEKQLMHLPTIGAKTALQIYTYRMLNGSFKSEEDLKKLPCWKGGAFDKFLLANNLLRT